MTITTQSADGQLHEFPDGTDPSVVDRVMKRYVMTTNRTSDFAETMASPGQTLPQPDPAESRAVPIQSGLYTHPAFYRPTSPDEATSIGFADTAGVGLADEMSAGLMALKEHFLGSGIDLGNAYDQSLTHIRNRIKQAETEQPAANNIGTAGGLAATLPFAATAKVAEGAGLLPKIINGAAGGALVGGVYGFNSGEGGVANRLDSAAQSAATGSLVGGTLPVAAKLLGGIPRISKMATETPAEFAARKVNNAAEAHGTTLEQAAADLAVARQTSPEMTLADALGMPGARLSKAIINQGGQGGDTFLASLTDRQLAQGDRVKQSISSLVGDPASYHGGIEQATRALKTNAAPLYEAAYKQPIDYAAHGDLLEMLKRVPSPAIAEANKIIQAEGSKSKQILLKQLPDGSFEKTTLPDVRQWDYIKQGLDTIINGAEGKGVSGGQTPYGRAVIGIKKDITNSLDEAVPEYGQARKVFSDDLSVKNAFEDGRGAFKADPEEIAKHIAGLDQASQQAYKIGAARAAADQIDKSAATNDSLRKIWNTPTQQARWKAILGPGANFDKFTALFENEGVMNRTFNKGRGGSSTAEQLNDLGDMTQSMLAEAAARTATRGPWNAMFNASTRLARRAGGLTDARAAKLAETLIGDGQSAVDQIAKQRQRDEMLATFSNMIQRFGTRGAIAKSQN